MSIKSSVSSNYCESQDLVCQVYYQILTTGITLFLAAILTAFLSFLFYKKRLQSNNNQVLHAMWAETKFVNLDCLQWVENATGLLELKRKIGRNSAYRPYSVNYRTSKQAVEKLMHDTPGINPLLIRLAFKYHYDDSVAVETLNYISSDIWLELDEWQKKSVIDDIHRSIEALRRSSKALHRSLSIELGIECDQNVQMNTLPTQGVWV